MSIVYMNMNVEEYVKQGHIHFYPYPIFCTLIDLHTYKAFIFLL